MRTSAAPERPSYHHGDLRCALIAAAEGLMREQEGWTFTLREVARAAGVSHNAPYNHFSDRRALLAAVAARAFDDFREAMEAEVAAVADADVATRLLASARGYVGFSIANPARFRLMFSAELADDEDVTLGAARCRSFDVLKDLIDEGVAAGAFRADPHGTHALAAWSLVHGLSHLMLDRRVESAPGEAGLAAITQTVGATLLEGLGRREPKDHEGPLGPTTRFPPERQSR